MTLFLVKCDSEVEGSRWLPANHQRTHFTTSPIFRIFRIFFIFFHC